MKYYYDAKISCAWYTDIYNLILIKVVNIFYGIS